MNEKPSYMTSTFSIMTLVVVFGFVALCLYKQDIVNLKELALMLIGGYSMKKGSEAMTGKSNGLPTSDQK